MSFLMGGGVIPDEYQLLEYIESTGNNYIDLNFSYFKNTEIEATFQRLSNNYKTKYTFLYGSRNHYEYLSDFHCIYLGDRESWKIGINDFENNLNIITSSDTLWNGILDIEDYISDNKIVNTKQRITEDSYDIIINDKLIYHQDINYKINSKFESIYLFDYNWSENPTTRYFIEKTRLYHFSIKNIKNNQYLRNLYPVKRLSDGLHGLYDTANNTFYHSENENDFIGSDT